jgi:hypothetical protein
MAKIMSSANRAFDEKVETYERVTRQKYTKTNPTPSPSPAIRPSHFVLISHKMVFFHFETNANLILSHCCELLSTKGVARKFVYTG